MPVQFALSPGFDADKSIQALNRIDVPLAAEHKADLLIKTAEVRDLLNDYKAVEAKPGRTEKELKTAKINVRMAFTRIGKKIGNELKNVSFMDDPANARIVKKEIGIFKEYTEFSPTWVTIMIALCLGLGTMIGWKRIAVTIGEKIGKRHMTYAEGATAELTAAATIGLSSAFGLPVSTTHVLSSGVAGAMTASKGVKNLQPGTIKTIALAWILTLPVTIILAGGFYYLLQTFMK
jgi:PiT family inorganic phosphate transporter